MHTFILKVRGMGPYARQLISSDEIMHGIPSAVLSGKRKPCSHIFGSVTFIQEVDICHVMTQQLFVHTVLYPSTFSKFWQNVHVMMKTDLHGTLCNILGHDEHSPVSLCGIGVADILNPHHFMII
jgi:hypothetical protein